MRVTSLGAGVLVAGAVLLAATRSSTRADQPTAITVFVGATLIDGTGRPPIPHATLIVEGDRIKWVGDGATGEVPAGARVVDVHGKTIIPGLISAHSHLGLVQGASTASPENYTRENVARQLAQYEAYGVTAVMSLGANRDVLYDWRRTRPPTKRTRTICGWRRMWSTSPLPARASAPGSTSWPTASAISPWTTRSLPV